ncbi:MAG TPA: hypothetical protein VJU13_11465 [Candidatus Nitrosocosmicus sp.]|nr:hypothetical protein [Candidatus Nitrosocosmicus sp.]
MIKRRPSRIGVVTLPLYGLIIQVKFDVHTPEPASMRNLIPLNPV